MLTDYVTIIPQARVGYEVIDSQRGVKCQVGYNHLISNKHEWNNCFIKNHQQLLLDFADFAWLELSVDISTTYLSMLTDYLTNYYSTSVRWMR